jgi:MscS family membrane protein
MFGGMVIFLDKPFTIGDWISTPSVEGTVEDITFRSTKIRTFAHALVTVPNATLANEPITNWSRMGKRRITFHLGVTYTTSRSKLEKCVQAIRAMLEEHPGIHKETIFVYFERFNESSLDIFLYFFTNTTDWKEYLSIREDVNFKIMQILEQEGVSVAFPSRSIYIEKVDGQSEKAEK